MERDYTVNDVPDEVKNFCEYLLSGAFMDAPGHDIKVLSNDVYEVIRTFAEDYDTLKVEDGVNDFDWSSDELNEDYFGVREEAVVGDVIFSQKENSGHPVLEFEEYEADNSDLHLMYFAVDPDNISTVEEQNIPSDITGLEPDVPVPEINLQGVSIDSDDREIYMGSLPLSDLTSY